MIITLHLVVEDLGLPGAGGGDEVLVQHVQDVLADVSQLLLNLQKKRDPEGAGFTSRQVKCKKSCTKCEVRQFFPLLN